MNFMKCKSFSKKVFFLGTDQNETFKRETFNRVIFIKANCFWTFRNLQ
jgi:hypothetical protein